ncbi:MAG: hypothetical protein M1818_004563 [Claussenomyces sp. TS43310]|nr:MAG: hypothetical protein M1818_004563 [Claussenomyces sp. TS43310]
MSSDDNELELATRATDASLDVAASLMPASAAGDNDNDWTDETADDDMEYEPTTETDSDEMQEFFEQLLENEDEDEEDDEDDEEYQARRQQVLRLLANSQLGRIFMGHGGQPRRRHALDPDRFPVVPSDKGTELMNSGNFGTSELQSTNSMINKKKLARRILDRELGTEDGSRRKANQRLMAQGMIPSSNADMIVHYDEPVYSGQFSDDGNFFYACVKDFKVRMYDTSNPYKWRYYKTVDYHAGRWTLTDATLSPDNKYLAYTSIQPTVCLAPTDPNDMGDPYVLDLSDNGNRGRVGFRSRHESFGIWSVRFSGDGRELVAGTSAHSIVVYDIESRRSVLEIRGHEEEVNAVCFGDVASPHILYSGSDDTTLKVWDRRSMGDSREAGAFVGHIEGLTYIDSKGDGRYILSNGKDQSMKLWDLRMVMSTARFAQIDTSQYTTNFDYRWGIYDDEYWQPHPHDNSLVTFRGHQVLRTLIRCHFSPPGSTNSRYVYTGSADGKVYVYNLDGTEAGKIDVFSATKDSRPYDMGQMSQAYHYDDDERQNRWRTCVRDASWHPNAPVVAASSWNGYGMATGTVSVHSWNDGAENDETESMGLRVNGRLQRDESLYTLQPRYVPAGYRRAR